MFNPPQGADLSADGCLHWSSKQSVVVYLPGMERTPTLSPLIAAGGLSNKAWSFWLRLCSCLSSKSNRKAAVKVDFNLLLSAIFQATHLLIPPLRINRFSLLFVVWIVIAVQTCQTKNEQTYHSLKPYKQPNTFLLLILCTCFLEILRSGLKNAICSRGWGGMGVAYLWN